MEYTDVTNKNDLYHFLIEQNHGSNSLFKESFFKKKFLEFYDKIIEYHKQHYTEEFKFSQKIYNYIFDITTIPICKMCNNIVAFNGFSAGYNKYCSYKCTWLSSERSSTISNTHKNKSKEEIKSANSKREKTCLLKYGVTHVAKDKSAQQKAQETRENRTDEEKEIIRNKCRNTWRKKTDKEIQEIARKRNETNSKKTIEEKEKSYKKSIETRIKNCGSLEESYKRSVEKNKNTCYERYGVENVFQTNAVIEKTKSRWNNYRKEHFKDVIEYIEDTETYICKCCDENCNLCKEKKFSITVRNYLNRKGYDFADEDICTIKNPIGEYRGKSKLQDDIYDYIKTIYDGKIIYNVKNILDTDYKHRVELDIFVPDIKIAFEINGDFWHMNPLFYSETDINSKTHKTAKETWEYDNNKKLLCEKLGIIVYTIWENDWKTNQEQEKQRIKNILKLL